LFNFNLKIKEVVIPGRRNIIEVYVEDILVYKTFLFPKYDYIEEKAKEATDRVLRFIIEHYKYLNSMEEIL